MSIQGGAAAATEPRWKALKVGDQLLGPKRIVTADRIRWYGDGMLSASAGEVRKVGSNIHTDLDYAKTQGLPDVIADGMLSTNWCNEMLLSYFGEHYLTSSNLQTKFIKPVFENVLVSTEGVVTAVETENDTTTYKMDVWCRDEDGTKLTVGDAWVKVKR